MYKTDAMQTVKQRMAVYGLYDFFGCLLHIFHRLKVHCSSMRKISCGQAGAADRNTDRMFMCGKVIHKT